MRDPSPPWPAPAADPLVERVYDELRALAARALRRERRGHTLQATALVHEAYLALAERPREEWSGAEHFRSAAAAVIRRILVDHARRRATLKRGSVAEREPLDDVAPPPIDPVRLLALDESLEALRRLNERQARVVELRWFAGLDIDEVAAELGISPRTVDGDWRMARAWLRRRLGDAGGP